MKKYFNYIALPALALGLVACEPEFDNDITENQDFYTSGSADFSSYVSVGNSLTAGFADGALYITGQENSYPNIMAQQFALAGGGSFSQPLVSDNLGGLTLGGMQITENRFVLATDADGNPGPARLAGTPTTEVSNIVAGPFNNVGVPGAKSFHLVAPGYGNVAGVATGQANPYFARFASSANTTVMAEALAANPTFFSLWIGNNDILGFATSGGAGADQTGNPDATTYGPNDITDPTLFAGVYAQEVAALTSTGAKGALVNIPDVTSIPFFTTVPSQAIPLDEETAATLNASFAAYNTQVLPGLASFGVITAEEAAARQINFSAGSNFITIQDEDLTDISTIVQGAPFNLDPITAALLSQLRQTTNDDLVPLTTAGVLGTIDEAYVGFLVSQGVPVEQAGLLAINGVSRPLQDQFVLTTQEQALVTAAQTQYNATIQALADANGLAYVDARTALQNVANGGVAFSGGILSSQFVTGGAFSLDGVHPTPRGYAFTANAVINAINSTYGSTIPGVDIGNYASVTISNDVN
ncbi:GDSL-like lipase/acylhydrolase family protein [Dokdonia sp. Hel_I_63]|uniref:SGNH/GDSL hydrolase family protein n=1 Tax=Dokdonia sp. Hel_I_63 TaxID=1249996 RepID=UPI00119B1000|nr:SGNH/GDSL hydrolase family protein [Dokdonia sp. Hel_I_63]TVZ21961.1 GDSL-like lipase/acylhydrolase family protein [Dokdonia sp. Hel_I_63]